jgi:hypothetical protein
LRPTLLRSFRAHADLLRRQFLQGGVPFTDVLTEDVLAQALSAASGPSSPWPAGRS